MEVKLTTIPFGEEDYYQKYDSVTFTPREDKVYKINIHSLHGDISKMVIKNYQEVEHVALTVGLDLAELKLVQVGPLSFNENGEVIFWMDWSWKQSYCKDASIIVTMITDATPIVEFQLKDDILWIPIFIPEQKWVPKRLEGTPYNNIVFGSHGSVVLRYVQ